MRLIRTLAVFAMLAGCEAISSPPPPPAAAPASFPAVSLYNSYLDHANGSPRGYAVYVYVLTSGSVPEDRRRALFSALTCETWPASMARSPSEHRGVVLFPRGGAGQRLPSAPVTAAALLEPDGYNDAYASDLMASLVRARVLPSITEMPIYLAILAAPIEKQPSGSTVYDLSRLSASELQTWLLSELSTIRVGKETVENGTRQVAPSLLDTLNDVGNGVAKLIRVSLPGGQAMLSCERST
jgi:hypothetical protein